MGRSQHPSPPSITSDALHWFRLRRAGLVEPFASPEETAARLIGVQAQLPPAAALAFHSRTAGVTHDALEDARLRSKRLVRFWGQRDTIHIYRTEDWPLLHAAFSVRDSLLRGRLERAGLSGDFRRLVERTAKRLENGEILTYRDIKAKRLIESQNKWAVPYVTFMQLVRAGATCHGPDQGTQSGFVHREHWVPKLRWAPPERDDALVEITRRYLWALGAVQPQDLAFWYGTTLANAKRWIELAGDDCCTVELDGRPLTCLRSDLPELTKKPPPRSRWPVRLLYRFDPLVLATKDKTWLIDDEHYKKVWRPSAHVEAVVLVRGRIAGTWRYDRTTKGLAVRVSPFAPLSRATTRAVEREAAAAGDFLGHPLTSLKV